MASFTERMIGAAKLEVLTYEEVDADATATGQAMAVVLLSSVAAGIGGIGIVGLGPAGLTGFLVGSVAGLIRWVAWGISDVLHRHPPLPRASHACRSARVAANHGVRAVPRASCWWSGSYPGSLLSS